MQLCWVAALTPRVAAFIHAGGDLREVGQHQPSQVIKKKILSNFLVVYVHHMEFDI